MSNWLFGTPLSSATHPQKWLIGLPWGVYTSAIEAYSGSFSASHSSSLVVSGKKDSGSSIILSGICDFYVLGTRGCSGYFFIDSASSFSSLGTKKTFQIVEFQNIQEFVEQVRSDRFYGISVVASQQVASFGGKSCGSFVVFPNVSSFGLSGVKNSKVSASFLSLSSFSSSGLKWSAGLPTFVSVPSFISYGKKHCVGSVYLEGSHGFAASGSVQEVRFGNFSLSNSSSVLIYGKVGFKSLIGLSCASFVAASGAKVGRGSFSLLPSSQMGGFGLKNSFGTGFFPQSHGVAGVGLGARGGSFFIDFGSVLSLECYSNLVPYIINLTSPVDLTASVNGNLTFVLNLVSGVDRFLTSGGASGVVSLVSPSSYKFLVNDEVLVSEDLVGNVVVSHVSDFSCGGIGDE